jgi:hypothetical protein
MREIQSLTLDRARTAQTVDALFAKRRSEFEGLLGRLARVTGKLETEAVWLDDTFRSSGTAMRCTAVPLMPINIEHITERPDLRIGVVPVRGRYKIELPGFPSGEGGIRSGRDTNPLEFQPALRGWSHILQLSQGPSYSAVSIGSDGLIERLFCDLRPATIHPDGTPRGLDFLELVAFFLGVVTSIEVFRNRTSTNEVPYELEFELIARHGHGLDSPDGQLRAESYRLSTRRTLFPRLLIGRRDTLSKIGDAIQIDIWNAAGQAARVFFEYDVSQSVNYHRIAS